MIFFDAPSFLIDGRDLGRGHGQITADQREHTVCAIFVCEDWLGQQQREIHAFQVDFQQRARVPVSRSTLDREPRLCVREAQGHVPVGWERHDEVLVQIMLDEHHVLRRGRPGVIEDLARPETLLLTGHTPLSVAVVLGLCARAACLPRLRVRRGLGLIHESIADRHRRRLAMLEGPENVDAFDVALVAMIVMPADDCVLVRRGLFLNRVIDHQHPLGGFSLTNMRLDTMPASLGCERAR